VVSNVDAEGFSQSLVQFASAEFRPLGLDIIRMFDLALELDETSLEVLRQFGKQESELKLQEKGARLATQQGFEEFNIVQGRRKALEGLGDGLANGNGPMLLSGGLGANLTGTAARAGSRPVAPRAGGVLAAGAPGFVIRSEGVDSGPYTARQVALLAISKGLPLGQLMIRGVNDSPDMEFAADLEPQILAEHRRRLPTAGVAAAAATVTPTGNAAAPVISTGSASFDVAMAATLQDGVLTGTELEMLANLAVALSLDANPTAAKGRIFGLLAGKNVRIDLAN
jgi:hypothetical protein